jgi:hypothetical protein
MHRLTTVSFVLFVVLSVTLAIVSGKRHAASAVDNMPVETATEAPVESLPAGQEGAVGPAVSEPEETTAPQTPAGGEVDAETPGEEAPSAPQG